MHGATIKKKKNTLSLLIHLQFQTRSCCPAVDWQVGNVSVVTVETVNVQVLTA
jgi:hypothetical protein